MDKKKIGIWIRIGIRVTIRMGMKIRKAQGRRLEGSGWFKGLRRQFAAPGQGRGAISRHLRPLSSVPAQPSGLERPSFFESPSVPARPSG